MKTKLFTLLAIGFLLFCGSAKSLKESVSITQIETDLPVIVRVDANYSDVFGIDFPFAFEYKDKFFEKRSMVGIDYYYHKPYRRRRGWQSSFSAYQIISGNLVRITRPGGGITGRLTENEPIVVYTRHLLDTARLVQAELRLYLEQIVQRNMQETGTLLVGTFSEFRARHPELVKNLLRGDSIEFIISGHGEDFYCPRRMALDTTIVLPIETFFMHIEE